MLHVPRDRLPAAVLRVFPLDHRVRVLAPRALFLDV